MIEKKQHIQSDNTNVLSILILLFILGILVGFGYYVFFKPELLGFDEQISSKQILVQGVNKDLKSVISEQTNIRLYFANSNFDGLSAEDRSVPKCSTLLEYAKTAINQLIKGPTQKGLIRTLPPNTSLRTVFVVDDMLIVDFSKELINQHLGGVSGELLTIYSIVNTLLELPQVDNNKVKCVKILINGYEVKTLLGHVNIELPLFYEQKLISLF